MAHNVKKYNDMELRHMSVEELQRIKDELSSSSDSKPTPPKQVEQPVEIKPTRPKPLPTQDCSEERQLLQEVSQLSSLEEMASRLEAYTRNNEPCLNIPTDTHNVTYSTTSWNYDFGATFGAPHPETTNCTGLCGDFNNDGLLNVMDVVSLVNFTLGYFQLEDIDCPNQLDFNRDGTINILDVVSVVNTVLFDNPFHFDCVDNSGVNYICDDESACNSGSNDRCVYSQTDGSCNGCIESIQVPEGYVQQVCCDFFGEQACLFPNACSNFGGTVVETGCFDYIDYPMCECQYDEQCQDSLQDIGATCYVGGWEYSDSWEDNPHPLVNCVTNYNIPGLQYSAAIGLCQPSEPGEYVGEELHNFSKVGYMYGAESFPDKECTCTVTADEVYQFGTAINPCAYEPVICLPAGTFTLYTNIELDSNTILRGHPDGTYIWFVHPANGIQVSNGVYIVPGVEKTINGLVERGSNIIPLNDTSYLQTGDEIAIYVQITDAFINEYGMQGYWDGESSSKPGGDLTQGEHLLYRRIIHTISENQITTDVPIRMNIGSTTNLPAKVLKLAGYKENIGIEDLFVSNAFQNYDHAWEQSPKSAIHLDGVKNSWIKNVSSFAPQTMGFSTFFPFLSTSGDVSDTKLPTEYPEKGLLTSLLENYEQYMSISSDGCVDSITLTGEPWHDSYPPGGWDGTGTSFPHDCEWYSAQNHCAQWGDCCENYGMTANEACCTCGGGGGILNAWQDLIGTILNLSDSFDLSQIRNVPLDNDTNLPEERHLASHGITIRNSKNVTIKDCYMALPQNRGQGGYGYLYQIGGSNEILVENSTAYRGRHNFTLQRFNSGIVFSRFYSSGGWNMSSDGIDGRDIDWYSRYQNLEVLGLGVIGKCDTHQQLNHAILVTDSDILDAVAAENRRELSNGVGHTSLDTIMWQIRGPGAYSTVTGTNNPPHTGWETMSIPGMGLLTSFSADTGYVVDVGNSMNVFYDIDNALDISDWASVQMADLIPVNDEFDMGTNTLVTAMFNQFLKKSLEGFNTLINDIEGYYESDSLCGGEYGLIVYSSPSIDINNIKLVFHLDDWFLDKTQPLYGQITFEELDFSGRAGMYLTSLAPQCAFIPCVEYTSEPSHWSGFCYTNLGETFECCHNLTPNQCTPWGNACAAVPSMLPNGNTCVYHEGEVFQEGNWAAIDWNGNSTIEAYFSSIVLDFEISNIEDEEVVNTDYTWTLNGSQYDFNADGGGVYCGIAELLLDYMNFHSQVLEYIHNFNPTSAFIDSIMFDNIVPIITQEVDNLIKKHIGLLEDLETLHTFTGEQNTEPDDVVTNSLSLGMWGVNNLYDEQRSCVSDNWFGWNEAPPNTYYWASCDVCLSGIYQLDGGVLVCVSPGEYIRCECL